MSTDTMLRVASESWALFELPPAAAQRWVAFVLPQGSPVNEPAWGFLPVASAWPLSAANAGLPSFAGYWVFAPRRPANPADFVTRLWNAPSAQSFQDLTMPVWIADPDADALAPVFLATVPGISNTIGSSTGLGFGGNFTFTVPMGSAYALSQDGSALEITAQGGFSLVVNQYAAQGFAATLALQLVGEAAGCLVLDAALSFDPSPSGADLGFHYAFEIAGGGSQSLSYPLFDMGAAGPQLQYSVSLDPGAPYDATRTRLAFKADTQALPTGLQSAIGQQVSLQPLPGAALVIRSMYGTQVGGGADSCLEPDGPFSVTLTPDNPDGATQVMPGFSGTESLLASGAMSLSFTSGPAYCSFDPTSASASDEQQPLSDMAGEALTAWAVAGAQPVQYCSQPPQSAFFQSGPGLADGFFQAANMGLSHDTALPALPLAAYGLLSPATSYELVTAFEQNVLAPARAAIFFPAHKAVLKRALAAPGPDQTYLTGRGLIVQAQGSAFTQIVLAVTTDSGGATHTWALTDIGPALSAALSANQCFVVATRSVDSDGGNLFAFKDGVAFADWLLTASVPPAGGGATLILKYGPQSVVQLAGQLAGWTDAATFNADPAAAQGALQLALIAIATGAGSPDPDLAALYAPMQQRLSDPAWNGVLVLQPTVATLPSVVAGIVAAGAVGTLPALTLGVAFSDVAGGGPVAPSLKGSAPFALIDCAPPAPAPAAASACRFAVTDIRVQFENASLTSFNALALLEINALFGLPVALQTPEGNDADVNDIVITGTYQAPVTPTAPGVYSFAANAPATFRFAYEFYAGQLLAKLLNTIQLATIRFAPVNPGTGPSTAVSRFDMGGSLSFWPPAQQAEQPPLLVAADLFNFADLGFSGLGLVVTGSGATSSWAFDVSRTSLAVAAAGLRQGLLTDLPLQPVRLAAAGSVAALGLIAPQIPSAWTSCVDAFDYAFVYQLDLGKPGAFAPTTHNLTATFVTGWQTNGAYALGFGIDGLGRSAPLGLQGVMQLAVDGIGIGPFNTADGQRLGISLLGCAVDFLGASFPSPSDGFNLALVAAPPYPASSLIWFGSHPTA